MDHVDFNCIFCAITAKRAPASVVYESADSMAFLDIRPITHGHVLVIPKKHCRNLFDLNDESGRAVIHAARVVARACRIALNADGINLFQSSERAAGQEVFHFHFHLVPRFLEDGLMMHDTDGRMLRWRSRISPTPQEFAAIAERIRVNIVDG